MDKFAIVVPSGIVEVSAAGVEIWNHLGRRLRQFSYPNNDLYVTVRGWHEKRVCHLLDGLIAELDRLPSRVVAR